MLNDFDDIPEIETPRLVDEDCCLWCLQDSRSFVGNCVLFWAAGGGYTTDLAKVDLMTYEKAISQHKSRPTDVVHFFPDLEKVSNKVVDMQRLKKL